MKRDKPEIYVVTLYIADLLATLVSLVAAEWLRRALPFGKPFDVQFGGLNVPIAAMAVAIWTVTFRQLSAYDPDRILRVANEIRIILTAVSISTLLLAGALYFSFRGLSRLLFGYFATLDILLILLFRLGLRLLFRVLGVKRSVAQRILVVGAGQIGCHMADLLQERRWMGLQVVGFLDDDPEKMGQFVSGLPVLGPLDQAPRFVQEHDIQEVIIALPTYAHARLEALVHVLNEMPVNIRVVPDFFTLAYLRTGVGLLGDMPLVTLKEPALNATQLAVKRVLDVGIAFLLLLLLWPALLLIALWIRLDSPGPVLFKQERVGWHGKPFSIYKFRTMSQRAADDQQVIVDKTEDGKHFLRKQRDDPRVTRVGRTLRRWSLDEWPQLINVLKGEMSLVGPRPELPFLVQDYEPWQYKRFSVPPGITGWWQITGRSDQPSSLNVEQDLYYVRNYSLWLDLQILLRTIGVVIRGAGAY